MVLEKPVLYGLALMKRMISDGNGMDVNQWLVLETTIQGGCISVCRYGTPNPEIANQKRLNHNITAPITAPSTASSCLSAHAEGVM